MDRTELEKAKQAIKNGEVVIFPTETAYGLAADATNKHAVEKVYQLKKRPRKKGITTIVHSLEQAKKYGDLTKTEEKIIEEFMPGPITLVAEKKNKEKLADNLNNKFVFRISSNDIARKLASEMPITATSANLSGKKTSYSVEDIAEELKTNVNHIIDIGTLEEKPTSTIAEIQDSNVIIHREGPISKEQIENVLTHDSGHNSTSN